MNNIWVAGTIGAMILAIPSVSAQPKNISLQTRCNRVEQKMDDAHARYIAASCRAHRIKMIWSVDFNPHLVIKNYKTGVYDSLCEVRAARELLLCGQIVRESVRAYEKLGRERMALLKQIHIYQGNQK